MSAFVVSNATIGYLVHAALLLRVRDGAHITLGDTFVSPGNAQTIAAQLLDFNRQAVMHRYPDADRAHFPGPVNPGPLVTGPEPPVPYALGQAFMSLACYEHQACEHRDWAGSDVQRFCDMLRAALIETVPGYADATWDL